MSDTSLVAERNPAELEPAGALAPTAFDQLRELVRNGYSPDAEPAAGEAILMRHAQAPDLLVFPDGRIEVPAHQKPKLASLPAALAAPLRKRMSKRRTFAIVVLAAIFWFFSAFFTAIILEGM